jgi:hypothetical protein
MQKQYRAIINSRGTRNLVYRTLLSHSQALNTERRSQCHNGLNDGRGWGTHKAALAPVEKNMEARTKMGVMRTIPTRIVGQEKLMQE